MCSGDCSRSCPSLPSACGRGSRDTQELGSVLKAAMIWVIMGWWHSRTDHSKPGSWWFFQVFPRLHLCSFAKLPASVGPLPSSVPCESPLLMVLPISTPEHTGRALASFHLLHCVKKFTYIYQLSHTYLYLIVAK